MLLFVCAGLQGKAQRCLSLADRVESRNENNILDLRLRTLRSYLSFEISQIKPAQPEDVIEIDSTYCAQGRPSTFSSWHHDIIEDIHLRVDEVGSNDAAVLGRRWEDRQDGLSKGLLGSRNEITHHGLVLDARLLGGIVSRASPVLWRPMTQQSVRGRGRGRDIIWAMFRKANRRCGVSTLMRRENTNTISTYGIIPMHSTYCLRRWPSAQSQSPYRPWPRCKGIGKIFGGHPRTLT